jgi:hypothetical protein
MGIAKMEGVGMTRHVLVCIALLLTTSEVRAQDSQAEVAAPAAPAPIILVVGAPGADEYAKSFANAAAKWELVAKHSQAELISIGRDSTSDVSDRDRLKTAIEGLDQEAATPAWLVMIGHGTYTGGVAKFNLRGLDVSATELAQWLKPVQRPVVIVNGASSSGPFVNQLSGERRVVVTATKSGTEQNYARFGQFFAEAIASPESDLDHDDEVSVQEAFLRASAEVRLFYETEARIATEHALLDDNGDGKGTPATMFRGTRAIATAKSGEQLDGATAAQITLAPTGAKLPFTAEELQTRAEIEAELAELRSQKEGLSEQEYDAKLEPLLLRLAKLYQAAEARVTPKVN